MKTRKYIEVQFQFEGTHLWKDAPAEVSFLRFPHRHEFHVKAMIEVHHDDRELEFIMVKRDLIKHVESTPYPIEYSCEQMAEELLEYICATYGSGRRISVRVTEDGENGSVVSYVGSN